MANISIDKVIEDANAALSDLYEFNRLLWVLMIKTVEAHGVVKEGTFEAVLDSAANYAHEKPGQVGEMLKDLIAMLRDPEAPTTRWRPEIIRGGRDD